MKVKIYLRMLLAAIAALFITTACSDSDEETGGGGTGPDEKPLTFKIAVSDIKDGQAKLAVTPSDEMATYYWSAVKKSIYDGLGSDEAFLEDEMAFIQKEATKNSMTLSAYLQWVTGRGTSTYTLTGLESKTEYYAYVYGIKTDGTLVTGVTKELFTAGEGGDPGPGPGDGPFTITISDVTATTAVANVVPEDKSALYMVDYLDEAGYAEVGNQLPEYVEYLFEYLQGQFPQYTLAEIVGILSNSGDAAVDLEDLDPSTKYYAYVIGVNTEGKTTTTAVVATPFTTGESAGGAPTISLTTSKGDYDGLNPEHNFVTTLKCTSSDATAAMYYPISKAELDVLLANGATLESLIEDNGDSLEKYLSGINGAGLNINTPQCIPGTEYCMIIQVTNAGGASTTEKINATTDGTPSAVTFDLDVTNITATGAKAAITPSNNTDKYFATIQKGVVATYDDRLLVELLEYTYTKDGSKFEDFLTSGAGALDANKLTANTEYCLIVFGHDGIGATTVVSKKMFTTTGGGETSDLTFKITTSDITYKSVKFSIEPSNNTDYYFNGIFTKVQVDGFQGSEAELIDAMISGNMPESGNFLDACDQGPVTANANSLSANTPYYVVCFGYANGSASTGLTKSAFSTTEKTAVTSPLFEDLLGNWSASISSADGVGTFDVQIAAGANDATAATYRANNSLVCLGFLPSNYTGSSSLVYRSPEDLINGTEGDYWKTNPDEANTDYGPKWFLEIGENDVVTVPASLQNTLHYYKNAPFYLLGVNGTGLRTGIFPVEVSADKNTITVKGFEADGKTYYPSVLANSNNNWNGVYIGTSEIVLTRKAVNSVSQFLVSGARSSNTKGEKRVSNMNSNRPMIDLKNAEMSLAGQIRVSAAMEIPLKAISGTEFKINSCQPASPKISKGMIEKNAVMIRMQSKVRSVRNN